ncbi:hypothetical protein D3C86_1698730 [compost metagenome]
MRLGRECRLAVNRRNRVFNLLLEFRLDLGIEGILPFNQLFLGAPNALKEEKRIFLMFHVVFGKRLVKLRHHDRIHPDHIRSHVLNHAEPSLIFIFRNGQFSRKMSRDRRPHINPLGEIRLPGFICVFFYIRSYRPELDIDAASQRRTFNSDQKRTQPIIKRTGYNRHDKTNF